jgi:subtilase family serine protease
MITMTIRTLRSLSCAAVALTFLAASLSAQNSQAVPNRITSPISDDQLVTLRGNLSPFANARNDRGPVSTSLAMPDLTLVLSRSPEQQAAFDQYVNSEYNSSSPNYHQWLTPEEIGERFGPSENDIGTIAKWLASQGFRVWRVTPDRMAIRFSGTAGLAESAFHTRIDNLVVHGVPHIGNMTNPSIPAALAPVVVGIKALHNFLPRPLHTPLNKVQFNRDLGGWQRVANGAAATSGTASSSPFHFASPAAAARSAAVNSAGPHPLFGINVPASEDESAYLEEDVTPWDFATIYNVTPLWNDGINGTGETIAIAGTSDIDLSDVTTFRSAFGLPAGSAPNEIDTNGLATECTSSTAICGIGDLEENTIDVEWSGAVAPDAQIDLVVSGQNTAGTVDSVYDSAQYVVDNLTARILNVSYGECELGNGTAENIAYYDLWQSAAAEGISVFVAAGDSGSASCDDGGDEIGNPYSAQYGLSVSGLASTPFNTVVGGTDFSWCQPTINSSGDVVGCPTSSTSQGSPAYWNTTNNTTTEPYESAAGYVPEIPWNDTCDSPIMAAYLESYAAASGVAGVSNAEAACNFVQNNWEYIYEESGNMLAPFVDTIGGSGGASNCVVNTDDSDPNDPTCTTGATTTGTANGSIALTNDGWQKPSWQSGVTGIPNDGVRDLPDVSFFAGDGELDSAYLVCVSAVGNCTYSNTSENTAEEAGGTSFASPAMAGVMALINEKAGSPQGLPNAELYQLAYDQDYADCSAEGPPQSGCYFHGIDQGTNSMPCDLGASIGGAVYEDGNWEQGEVYEGINSPNCTALNEGDTVGTLTSTSVVSSGNSAGVAYNAGEPAGYNMATGLGSLNVANVVDAPNTWISATGTGSAPLTYSLAATTPSGISPGGTATSTITGQTSSTNYTGTVALNACILTSSSVSNPTDPPECSVSGSITYASGTASGSGTASVTTTGTSALLHQSPVGGGWSGAGGGAVLALLVFLGVPKRRRNWLAMLGILVLFAGLGGLSGCGGGGGSTTTTTTTTSGTGGTSAGTYTFTVTGTSTPGASATQATTFTVTVN